MSKVAINKCYGGFSISKECAKWIENKYGIDLSKEYDYGAYYFDEKRHAKELIDAIETLGSMVCSGGCAKIALEDCSSGLYQIEDYDGYETLITPDDEREWIKIEEEVDEN